MTTPNLPPSPEAIALLPLFDRLGMHRITLVSTAAQAKVAAERLIQTPVWGFDTESKPTFRAGEISTGPHIVQLATLDHAWIFQLHDPECRAVVGQLLASEGNAKAGFGLGDDKKRIRSKLGVEPAQVVELNTLFRSRGYRKELGVKSAVAVLFDQRFIKSKKASTSNWALPHLSEQQLIYAANDAYAAARVWHALQALPPTNPPLNPLTEATNLGQSHHD
jgi:3'-5' exonuclease